MALAVQKVREIQFQLLFSRDFKNSDWEEVPPLIMSQLMVPKSAVTAAQQTVNAIWVIHEELDRLITEKLINYSFDRVSKVELAILRLALYEMRYTDLPPKVAIAEALRLARKYATSESVSFVNGILNEFYQLLAL